MPIFVAHFGLVYARRKVWLASGKAHAQFHHGLKIVHQRQYLDVVEGTHQGNRWKCRCFTLLLGFFYEVRRNFSSLRNLSAVVTDRISWQFYCLHVTKALKTTIAGMGSCTIYIPVMAQMSWLQMLHCAVFLLSSS